MFKDMYVNKRETNAFEKLNVHNHNFYELILLESGACTFKINNHTYQIEGPALIFINNLENHSVEITSVPYKTIYLILNKDTLKTLLDEPILSSIFINRPDNYSHILKLTSNKELIIKIFTDLYNEFHTQAKMAPIIFKAYFQTLFVYLYRDYTDYFPIKIHSQINNLIFLVEEYIDKNYMEELSLEQLASTFFISPSYLSRSFKKITGYNLKEYLILQRISKATELLIYSSLSIIEICNHSGFNNVNHFIRAFKKHTGLTPKEYRNHFCHTT